VSREILEVAAGMYLLTGFYVGLLIVIAMQITEDENASVLDMLITLVVHVILWPRTVFCLVDDVFYSGD
jgi:hypothetical protein